MDILKQQNAENLQQIKARIGKVSGSTTAFKIQRIKGATDYSRAITYYGTTVNPTIVVHTGTTDLGSESITETISYVDAPGGDFRVSSVIYS